MDTYLVSIYPAFCVNIVPLYVATTHSAFAVSISNSLVINMYSLQATIHPLMW